MADYEIRIRDNPDDEIYEHYAYYPFISDVILGLLRLEFPEINWIDGCEIYPYYIDEFGRRQIENTKIVIT